VPRMNEATLAAFLQQPHVGVIATVRADGRPYTVPVWWLWDAPTRRYWLTGTTNRIWCRQLERNADCSLCIEALAPVAGHVGIDGRAVAHTVPDFDIWPMSRRLAEKYVGRGDGANATAVDRFFANMKTEPRMLFSLEPVVVRAIDMRVYRGKRADREFQERRN
jgi:PPOX class probable F420-dependent enzyme